MTNTFTPTSRLMSFDADVVVHYFMQQFGAFSHGSQLIDEYAIWSRDGLIYLTGAHAYSDDVSEPAFEEDECPTLVHAYANMIRLMSVPGQ